MTLPDWKSEADARIEKYRKSDVVVHASTDATVDWVRQHNLRFRGHTMIWQSFKYGVPLPAAVEQAARNNDPE